MSRVCTIFRINFSTTKNPHISKCIKLKLLEYTLIHYFDSQLRKLLWGDYENYYEGRHFSSSKGGGGKFLTDFLEGGAKYEKTKFACKNTKKSQFGGGGQMPPCPPPQWRPCIMTSGLKRRVCLKISLGTLNISNSKEDAHCLHTWENAHYLDTQEHENCLDTREQAHYLDTSYLRAGTLSRYPRTGTLSRYREHAHWLHTRENAHYLDTWEHAHYLDTREYAHCLDTREHDLCTI